MPDLGLDPSSARTTRSNPTGTFEDLYRTASLITNLVRSKFVALYVKELCDRADEVMLEQRQTQVSDSDVFTANKPYNLLLLDNRGQCFSEGGTSL